MTKTVWPLSAILALAMAAGAEDPAPVEPAIRLTTLPNPIADPIASANRRARLAPDRPLESLPGIFSVRHPGSPISYAWDPVECRLLFCQRDTALIYLAEGPAPAAPTVGAYGAPNFFGYRLTEGGVPEFLYMHGRLGVEEQIRPAEDGRSLKQRFRIENADHGLILAVPERWKNRVKSTAGSWSGDVLKLSKTESKAGFTLTYNLSELPEQPETAPSWNAPASTQERAGPPPPPAGKPAEFQAEAAPGFSIEPVPIPDGQKIGSLAPLDDDALVVTTKRGGILISQTGEAGRTWAPFFAHSIETPRILDAGRMPGSLLVSHAYGKARLFDTDADGKADFFKAIDTSAESKSSPAGFLTLTGWDVFRVTLESAQQGQSGAAGLHLAPQGLNRERPRNASDPGPGPAIWIPSSICTAPATPLILAGGGTDPSFENRIAIADRSAPDDWRFARIFLDRVDETLQGAVTDGRWASQANRKLGHMAASADGASLWVVSEAGDLLARITRENAPGSAFAVRSVHLAPDAFEFRFSQPVDRKTATALSRFRIRSTDPSGKDLERHHKIEAAICDSDGLVLAIRVAGLTPGRLVEFDFAELRSETGGGLSHGPVFYTVNAWPRIPMPESVTGQPASSTVSSASDDAGAPNSEESSPKSRDTSEPP